MITFDKFIRFTFNLTLGVFIAWLGFLALSGKFYYVSQYFREIEIMFRSVLSRPFTGWSFLQAGIILLGLSFVVRAFRKLR